jgi:glycosyltransferase involved in cell wall biosynthesis
VRATAIVLTKNEERAIENCLHSLSRFEQIIVVDSNSTDNTCEIAKNLNAEILQFNWDKKYQKKKQWALENSRIRNDWVLFVDADERVSDELSEEIDHFLNSKFKDNYAAAQIKLEYFFCGQRMNYGHKVKKVALINKNKAYFPPLDDLKVSNMWEVEGHYQPTVDGTIYNLKGHIEHIDPDPLFDYFSRHNRYSDWEAYVEHNPELRLAVRGNRSLQGKFFEMVPYKPLVFFIYSFIIRSGWRDGRIGFDYAMALSFYYWQIRIKSRELKLRVM